ncbi:lactate dehydrogenase [Pullulanibacillus camelliae]|uniref:Lactate dehydrogenase n=1 Tax=Pullulanibacillus camelliae TaxID=1707096 RepID=A0A8J2VP52_9BACL|nr:Ldh family oxidoreductase [Pullulanibacillus camelliae]GGE42198.1 lactate dehydrogenase [Pullulanibacillus camelliae]
MGVKDKVIKKEQLVDMASKMLEAGGLSQADALTIAEDLVAADLRGLTSHGVSRIPMYLNRISKKLVNTQPDIKVEKVTPAAAIVDGDDGMGFIVSHKAIEEGIQMAQNMGIALVGVRHSTHFGMAALYVKQAIEAGCICIAFTNSSPALPAWGGRTTFLGAAPLATGIPGGHHSPDYVLDMAMTVIARGKIRVAATNGEPIPEGLALDKDGAPTTDAKKAFEGVCLPFGGAKGSALAMMMDLMAGMFTGANFGGDVKSLYFDHSEPQNVGHLFFVIKPDLFVSMDEYKNRMDTFYSRLKNLPRAQGFDEIMMPGEPEERVAKERSEKGIPLSGEILSNLSEVAQQYHLEFPELFN